MPSTDADPGAGGARPPVFVAAAEDLARSRFLLRGREGRHASTVRRIGPGERVDVTDGAGTLAECVVLAARPGELELAVQSASTQPRPQPVVTVIQAIPKGDRGELAVELLTEVGVDVIVPWAAQRCVAVWRGERAARGRGRWQAAAVEAAKQSRRSWLPEVTEQADLTGIGQRVAASALAVVLDPAAGQALASVPLPASGEIVLVVGPEGGITAGEAAALQAAGAVGARLGPTVLRTSSAGAVAAGALLSRTARWS